MHHPIVRVLVGLALGALLPLQEADAGAKCPLETKTVTVYVEGYGATPQAARRATRAKLDKAVSANRASLKRWAVRQHCNRYCTIKHAGAARAEKIKEGIKPAGIRMKAGLARSKGPIYSARHKAYVDGYSEDVAITVTCTRR